VTAEATKERQRRRLLALIREALKAGGRVEIDPTSGRIVITPATGESMVPVVSDTAEQVRGLI
jgi:hypothetical protein